MVLFGVINDNQVYAIKPDFALQLLEKAFVEGSPHGVHGALLSDL
ncbi:MAG: hypothetical protein ACYDDN_02935 [Candidatus Desulforudaceae bacterium]